MSDRPAVTVLVSIYPMRQRWLSRRAIILHVSVLVWVPMCLVAGWWQVTRALGGNGLSYLYSVEWPVFAAVGVVAWWSLVHTDPDTVGARAQKRMLAAAGGTVPVGVTGVAPDPGAGAVATGGARVAGHAAAADGPGPGGRARPGPPVPARRREDEDEALAAYNDRLAALATAGQPKTWRRS